MKIICTVLLLLFANCAFAQKYALIDRQFKKPILFTDSVTINQVSNNYFPVRVNDLDSLVANFNYLIEELKFLQRSKFKSYKLKSGNTVSRIKPVPKAYGDSYQILLTTSTGDVKAEYLISDGNNKNKTAIKSLRAFIDYVKKDKKLTIKEFREYTPVIYEATIFIPSR